MFTLIVVVLGITVIGWYLFAFNALVSERTGIDHCWANIEVELKRRLELIENLVRVTKGYAAHESEALQAAVKYRGAAIPDAASAGELQESTKKLANIVFALKEGYPDLKANEEFCNLSANLADTENRIAERRGAYNQMVARYQVLRQEFPSKFIAESHGFGPRSFFDSDGQDLTQVPKVVLS